MVSTKFRKIIGLIIILAYTATVYAGTAADFINMKKLSTVKNGSLNEASGIAASQTTKGVFYLHNDSGEKIPRVFATDRNGKDLGEYVFPGINSVGDWEDIAVGPGPEKGKSYIYVGRIGDNPKNKDIYYIYMAEEPKASLTQSAKSRDLPSKKEFKFKYDSKGTSRNSECLMVDPLTADVYIVTKGPTRHVYRYPAPLDASKTAVLEYLGRIPEMEAEDGSVTGGDMTATEAVIRINKKAYYYHKGNKTWDEVFKKAPELIEVSVTSTQNEAICFDADGIHLYTKAEAEGQPIYFIERDGAVNVVGDEMKNHVSLAIKLINSISTSKVSLNIEKSGNYMIKLYRINGSFVKAVALNNMKSGVNLIHWNLGNLSSSEYIMTLEGEGIKRSGKVILF